MTFFQFRLKLKLKFFAIIVVACHSSPIVRRTKPKLLLSLTLYELYELYEKWMNCMKLVCWYEFAFICHGMKCESVNLHKSEPVVRVHRSRICQRLELWLLPLFGQKTNAHPGCTDETRWKNCISTFHLFVCKMHLHKNQNPFNETINAFNKLLIYQVAIFCWAFYCRMFSTTK